MSNKPTITGKALLSDSDAENIAKSFKDAMKGLGSDENRIIKEISLLTNKQRQIVKEKYLAIFGHTLEEDLNSELSGDFEDIIIALLKPRYEFEAECLKKAIHLIGTQDHVVIELLCTKERAEIEKLKETYKNLYNSELENDLKHDEHHMLGRIYRSLATGDRPTGNHVDTQLAQTEAQQLYDAGEGIFGTDESEFVRIMVSRSFSQLKATFVEYEKISGHPIEVAIKKETSGDLKNALISFVQSIRDKPEYFARRLHDAMNLPGITKDHDIIRILVTRCEIDMENIKEEYQKLYNKSLHDHLKSELRGQFEHLVLVLVGN